MRSRSSALRSTKYCRAASLATSRRAPFTPATAACASEFAASRAARMPPARSISQATSMPARNVRVSGRLCLTGSGAPLWLRDAAACAPTVGHNREPCISAPARAWTTRCSAMLTSWLDATASLTSLARVGSPNPSHQSASSAVAEPVEGTSFEKLLASGTGGDRGFSAGAEHADRMNSAKTAVAARLDRMRTWRRRCSEGLMGLYS